MIKKLKDIDLIMMRGNKRDLTCLFGTNMKIKDKGWTTYQINFERV